MVVVVVVPCHSRGSGGDGMLVGTVPDIAYTLTRGRQESTPAHAFPHGSPSYPSQSVNTAQSQANYKKTGEFTSMVIKAMFLFQSM